MREVWGHQAGTSCPCETGGKCAASARCGSASKSFLTACSCQTHPCHLAPHSMSKAGGQRLLVHQGCGQQQHPWVSQTLTNPGHDFPRSEQDQSFYRVLIPLIKTLVIPASHAGSSATCQVSFHKKHPGPGEPLFALPSPACSPPSTLS